MTEQKNIYIPPKELKKVIDIYFPLDKEACGYFIKNGLNTVEIFLEKMGIGIEGRRACVSDNNHNYIWHTHPYVSKSYPSAEDVRKVLRVRSKHPNNPRVSVIFTKWGVWKIAVEHKVKLSQELKEFIIEELNTIATSLYRGTKGGHEYNGVKVIEYIYNVNKFINSFFEYAKVGFKIGFMMWSDISKEQGYILNI
jgi:hypothetical protein